MFGRLTIRVMTFSLILGLFGPDGFAVVRATEADPKSLRYFMGHDVVVMNIAATAKTIRKIETVTGAAIAACVQLHLRVVAEPPQNQTAAAPTAGGKAAPKPKPDQKTESKPETKPADPELCVTQQVVTTREGTAALKLVPNPQLAASLVVPKSAFTESEMTVEFRDGMMLKAINVKSTGRAGEVISSIAKFAGVLIGGFAGLASVDGDKRPRVIVSPCDPFTAPYKDLPDPVRLLLWENAVECQRWQETDKLQKSRTTLVEDRVELEKKIRGASNTALEEINDRLTKIETALENIDKDIAPRVKQFNATLEAYAKTLDLGTTTAVATHDQVLQLSDLPVSDNVKAGMTAGQIEQVLATFSEPAKTLWERGKAIVTFDPSDKGLLKCPVVTGMPPAPEKDNQVHVAFRQGTPGRLRVFVSDLDVAPTGGSESKPQEGTLRSVADRFENVAHPCAPIGTMVFKRSAWSSRELAITFDERGFPSRLESKSGSDAAAIATSLAAAATTFRDEVATTVEKVVGVQENQRKIALNDATRRLDELKKDKEILDAQLALDAGRTNLEASLKQQVAAASMAQLQAEVALGTAQDTAEQRREIERLKIQIDLVKQQLDLLNAKQELAKAEKKE